MSKKVLFFVLISFVFCNCKEHQTTFIKLKINEVDLVYSKPYVSLNYDNSSKFKSEIFLDVKVTIENKTDKSANIVLNDLKENDYSFELIGQLNNNNIKFYNYSFSNHLLPYKNSFIIEKYDSSFLNLESPLLYYKKELENKFIDSLLKEVKKMKFKINVHSTEIEKPVLDTSNVNYQNVPVYYSCNF